MSEQRLENETEAPKSRTTGKEFVNSWYKKPENREKCLQERREQYKKDKANGKYEARKEKVECECGSVFCIGFKSKHLKSTKHKAVTRLLETVRSNPIPV